MNNFCFRTEYEDSCKTVYDTQCETKYDTQCETKYEVKVMLKSAKALNKSIPRQGQKFELEVKNLMIDS